MAREEEPQRFLIVRLDGLGDTVLTTPLLRAIREHWPRARVTVIASPAGHACLVGHPGVDELIVFSPSTTTLGQKLALGKRLRAASVDVALTATEKAWGYLWLRMSGAPRRIGFRCVADKPLKSLLFSPTLTDPVEAADELAEVERHLRLLEPLGVREAPGPLWLSRPQGPGSGPVALHLSKKWVTEGWSETWLLEMIEALAAENGLLVTAGGLEGQWAGDLCARVSSGAGRIDTLLDVSYDSWTRALADCRLMVSMDTGAVHVAAGLGLPVVDVFPAADAERCVSRWRPWKVPHRVVLREGQPSAEEQARVVQEILDASRSLLEAAMKR